MMASPTASFLLTFLLLAHPADGAFAPPAMQHSVASRPSRHALDGARAVLRMQQSPAPQPPPVPSFTEKAFVRRGGLVWPHVHAAWLMIAAVLEFCARLGQSPTAQNAHAPRTSLAVDRTIDPMFVQGALCERVTDAVSGHEFYVCQTDVDNDEYACRCAAKDGKFLWFCTKAW